MNLLALLHIIGGALLLAGALLSAAAVARPQSAWARRFRSSGRRANIPAERHRRVVVLYAAVGYGFYGACALIVGLVQAFSPHNTTVGLLFLPGSLVALVCLAAVVRIWLGARR